MKTSILSMLVTTFLGSLSYAATVENVLIGPGVFPSQPNEFIKCVVEKGLERSKIQFLGLSSVNPLASDSYLLEIKFLGKDAEGRNGFFKIIAQSIDQNDGWQKLSASNQNTYYFSKSVSSVALLMPEGGVVAAVFDFGSCQN